jgi:threonine aldolase
MRSFASDNNSGIHPSVLQAIVDANHNHCIAYGDDLWTEKARQSLKQVFGEKAEVFFVFNGTGANVLALQSCLSTYHCVLAASTAHIAVDECGAPEFMTGSSLKTIPTPDGKLTPDHIRPWLSYIGVEHHSQPKVIYISQCTEVGTVYTIEEIKALCDFAHKHQMYVHMDGARLANAAAALGKSLKEVSLDSGIDILSFGGTKNGIMMGEAVITFRKELAENMKYIRKQSAQLCAKMRYISAQFIAYMENDLWLQNARHANRMAQYLRNEMAAIHPFTFTQATDANILLLKLPQTVIEQLLQKHFFYIWNEAEGEIRLVTSWDTTEEDIKSFIEYLHKLI